MGLLDFGWTAEASAWVGLLTLVALEVVLGIDNIVFISILSNKLPTEQRAKARKQGLIFAVIPRLLFLLFIGLILQLTSPIFTLPFGDPGAHIHDTEWVAEHPKEALWIQQNPGKTPITGQDLVLLIGGIFLLVQAVREIHHKLEGDQPDDARLKDSKTKAARYGAVILQIMLMNIVFSLDSIITAIGMVKQVSVMVLAVLISTGIMIYAVNPISHFVEKHPTVKMLALAFLILIGTNLMVEALHYHIPKGYTYFAMGFSVLVEMLNIRAAKKPRPLDLHESGT